MRDRTALLARRIRERFGFAPRGQRGSTLVIALVAVGVVSLLALVGTSWVTQLHTLGRRYSIKDAPRIFLMNLKGRLNNDSSWAQTVSASGNSSAFSCLLNPAVSCCGITSMPFATYDQSGNLFYDPGISTAGFNYSGETCSPFDEVHGNDECPFHAEAVWDAVNLGNSPLCKDVRITVSFRLKTTKGDFAIKSDEVVGRTFVRGPEEGSLASHCASLGGTFDQTSNDCTLRGATSLCGPGTYMKGFDSAGNTVCGAVNLAAATSCRAGQGVQVANFAGGGVAAGCAPFPMAPPCGPDWHQEGMYCYFNLRNPCSATNASAAIETWTGGGWSCRATDCDPGFNLVGGSCI